MAIWGNRRTDHSMGVGPGLLLSDQVGARSARDIYRHFECLRLSRARIEIPPRSLALNMGWPADITWYKLLTDWGSLVAGSLGFAAAIVAVLLAMSSERRKTKRELESLRRALGVEVRDYTWNSYRAHVQLKAMIVGHVSPIPALFVEDKSRLPPPQIYPNAAVKIGEFGECAANIVLFFNRIGVTREAAERLLRHPSADNLPSGEIAWAVERLISIAQVGINLLPYLKTSIVSQDSTDAEVIKKIQSEVTDWAGRRTSFGVS